MSFESSFDNEMPDQKVYKMNLRVLYSLNWVNKLIEQCLILNWDLLTIIIKISMRLTSFKST